MSSRPGCKEVPPAEHSRTRLLVHSGTDQSGERGTVILTELAADPSVLLPFILIGFTAQLIDGALGMAYGVISSTLLIGLGVPPKVASAGVHTAEIFTTGISAANHIAHRNVDWRLFLRIVIPGAIGGALGAYVLSNIHADVARPLVLLYLAALGLILLWRGWTHRHVIRPARIVEPLGLAGGFLDAAGGGGWGPVVTSNLMVQGTEPRYTIGTVNTAEFFVTLTISTTFLFTLGWEAFSIPIIGLLIGGVLAAPLGAIIAKRVAADKLLVLVGVVLVITSGWGLWRFLS